MNLYDEIFVNILKKENEELKKSIEYLRFKIDELEKQNEVWKENSEYYRKSHFGFIDQIKNQKLGTLKVPPCDQECSCKESEGEDKIDDYEQSNEFLVFLADLISGKREFESFREICEFVSDVWSGIDQDSHSISKILALQKWLSKARAEEEKKLAESSFFNPVISSNHVGKVELNKDFSKSKRFVRCVDFYGSDDAKDLSAELEEFLNKLDYDLAKPILHYSYNSNETGTKENVMIEYFEYVDEENE